MLVRPSSPGRMLWEESDRGGRIIWCRQSGAELASMEAMLHLVHPAHAHVHHMMGIPEALLSLLVKRGVPYDLTIHDYYTICPRVNLIGERGAYCGEPDPAGCNRCLARLGDDQGRPVTHSISGWRDRSDRWLRGARRVFAPSQDVFQRIKRYFPDLSIHVRPHPEPVREHVSQAVSLVEGETARVAVIGTIVAVKGSDRLLACAWDARRRRLPLEFHVIGATDSSAALARAGNVHVTGRYREEDVYEHLGRARPHLAFLPSVCPESYMYTLSTAMAARLFVVCFDIGAQAERVRAWGWGDVLAYDLEPGEVNDALLRAARRAATAAAPPPAPRRAAYPGLLKSYYGFTPQELDRFGKAVTWHVEHAVHHLHGVRRKDDAHIH